MLQTSYGEVFRPADFEVKIGSYSFLGSLPGKFCNRLLTEILTEVRISHSLTEFNQHFNR